MADAEPRPQPFLWVNKTIHSSALSNNKGDTARIRSVNKHVQRWRTRSATTKKALPATDGPTVIGWRLNNYFEDKDTKPDEEQQAKSELSALLKTVPPSWGSPVDPFKSSSVPITSEVFGFLRYFTESFLAAAIQTQVQNVLNPKKAPSSHHAGSMKIVHECVADEKHMYSVLALTTHQIKYIIGHKLTQVDRPEYYMAKALEGLRKALEPDGINAMSQQIILDFSWMAAAEAYRGNFAGAMVHREINLFIVNRFGGFDKVDPFAREICRIGDIFISSLTLKAPIFGLAGDPGPISEDFRAGIDRRIFPQHRMGTAFLQHEDLWNAVMTDVIGDLLDIVQAAQYLWAFPESEVSSEDRDWVLQRCHALTHKLLCMAPTSPTTTIEEAIQECCRQCFVLWLFYVLAGTAGIPSEPGSLKRSRDMMPEHSRRLRQAVESADALDADETLWGTHGDLKLWVLAFGTLSGKTDGYWFGLELGSECNTRGIYTYDALAAINSRYLSLDRLEQLSNRKLARTLIVGMVDD